MFLCDDEGRARPDDSSKIPSATIRSGAAARLEREEPMDQAQAKASHPDSPRTMAFGAQARLRLRLSRLGTSKKQPGLKIAATN
mmetsp:Transcript_47490/g.111019  ORF Transcript_47490/g.111019 Transcript_47490/m.111019 type:complete len:84 (+) Transcript_47490:1592-1843(+)